MKITVERSGPIPLVKTYQSDAIPNQGDTIMVNSEALVVYDRLFDFEKRPGRSYCSANPKARILNESDVPNHQP